MANLVCTMAVAHAPGLTGWLEVATPEQQTNLKAGYAELGRLLRESRPDVILGFSNDHLLNLPLDNTPEQFAEWLADQSEQWGRLIREAGVKAE